MVKARSSRQQIRNISRARAPSGLTKRFILLGVSDVEMAGFEPATPCVQIWYPVCRPVLSCAVECRSMRVSTPAFVVLCCTVSPCAVPRGSKPVAEETWQTRLVKLHLAVGRRKQRQCDECGEHERFEPDPK
jgi:hypothetical protein